MKPNSPGETKLVVVVAACAAVAIHRSKKALAMLTPQKPK
jgi:hypothetical protein